MRIKTSGTYHDHGYLNCPVLDECDRMYCKHHRFLWRDCETAVTGYEGDNDVVNGRRRIMELGDAPCCMVEKWRKQFNATNVCPECKAPGETVDDIAIHLMKVHNWMFDKAAVWLREQIEEVAFAQYQ